MQAVEACMRRLDEKSILEEVFLYVFAPTLTEYVEWVLREAVKAGKKRLYFLARDGAMMYRAAQMLAQARELELDIRYLRVSRYAIRSAEYYFAGRSALEQICVGGIDISFEKLMKRANLTEEEALQIAEMAGYQDIYHMPLNYRQILRLKEELSRIELLFTYIQTHAGEAYKTTAGYLIQEGLLEEVPYALVDSGWVGTLQLSLQRVLEHISGKEIHLQGYYFGIYERPKETEKSQYRAFYFGEKSVWRKVYFSNCLFETVFSSPEGMTLGYQCGGEGAYAAYTAIESAHKNPNAETMTRFIRQTERYIFCYAKAEAGKKHRIAGRDGTKLAEALLSPMMGTPTQMEAEAFGSLQFCDDVLELQLQPVAAEWDEEELRKQRFFSRLLIKMNRKRQILHESAWAEGSITRLGGTVKKHMRHERWYKRVMYLRKAIRS